MRYGFGLPALTPNVTRFLILIIASYLAFALFGRTHLGISLYYSLLLIPEPTIYSFQIWRLASYGFLHDLSSPMHLIFNALILYMIGPQLEDRWGERRFFIFIMVAIILGGLMVCLSYLLHISNAPVAGFSAASIGLIIAWGLTFSTQQIFIFGIIPLTGKQLVIATVALEIIYAVSANSISSAAHFGGIIAGFIFTFGLYKPRRIKQFFKQRSRKF